MYLEQLTPTLGLALFAVSSVSAQTAPWTFSKTPGTLAGDAAWSAASPRYGADGWSTRSASPRTA